MSDPTLRTIVITICEPCLNGQGSECHTPGCALCLHRVDLPIDPVWYRVLDPDLRSDIRTGARALRSSSWPGEMAEHMEQVANRLARFAADPAGGAEEVPDRG